MAILFGTTDGQLGIRSRLGKPTTFPKRNLSQTVENSVKRQGHVKRRVQVRH
jgi:hypothetical protein